MAKPVRKFNIAVSDSKIDPSGKKKRFFYTVGEVAEWVKDEKSYLTIKIFNGTNFDNFVAFEKK